MSLPESERETVAALAEEMMRCEHPITVVLRPSSAFHLVALLQLAKRHPHVSEDARVIADTFIEHVAQYFEHAGASTVVDVIYRGDDPTFDRFHKVEPLMRLYHRTLGGHVHCRMFAQFAGSSAQAGTLTFSLEEWPAVRETLARSPWLDLIDEAAVQ